MSYIYEIFNDSTKEYISAIDKIESLRSSLNDIPELSGTAGVIYNNVAIEGNTFSRAEVSSFLIDDITIRGKQFKEHAQIHNYQCAYEALKKVLKQGTINIDEEFICQVHKLVTADELPAKESGFYRTEPVSIRYTNYIPPSEFDVPDCVNELIRHYNNDTPLKTQFEKICEFKYNFERIHPFIDGNGRTGRLLMNFMFVQNGYPPVGIQLSERDLYFKSLDNGTFTRFMISKMTKELERVKDKYHTKEDRER